MVAARSKGDIALQHATDGPGRGGWDEQTEMGGEAISWRGDIAGIATLASRPMTDGHVHFRRVNRT